MIPLLFTDHTIFINSASTWTKNVFQQCDGRFGPFWG